MTIIEIPQELQGMWKKPVDKDMVDHKFYDRPRTIKLNWNRLHTLIPNELTGKKIKCLDVGSGNGSTLEILRWYGHDAIGMDYTPNMDNRWRYKSLIDSQGLNVVCHSGAEVPYPFKNKEFDLLICYGVITFFKPVENWPKILDEFARITKRCILLCVNVGDTYEEGKKYINNWNHTDFGLEWISGSTYRFVSRNT